MLKAPRGALAMRNRSICLLLLLASCSSNESTHVTKDVRCVAFGGFEAKVCPVSMLALVADPNAYDGKVVAIQGVVGDSGGTALIFPNAQFVADGDVASAVVCRSSTAGSCAELLDHRATFIGKFSVARSDDNLFAPVGSVTLMHVRGARPSAPEGALR